MLLVHYGKGFYIIYSIFNILLFLALSHFKNTYACSFLATIRKIICCIIL